MSVYSFTTPGGTAMSYYFLRLHMCFFFFENTVFLDTAEGHMVSFIVVLMRSPVVCILLYYEFMIL